MACPMDLHGVVGDKQLLLLLPVTALTYRVVAKAAGLSTITRTEVKRSRALGLDLMTHLPESDANPIPNPGKEMPKGVEQDSRNLKMRFSSSTLSLSMKGATVVTRRLHLKPLAKLSRPPAPLAHTLLHPFQQSTRPTLNLR